MRVCVSRSCLDTCLVCGVQVCLAAETCGHVDFNTRGDVWYSSEPFRCGDIPPGHVTYWQIFHKVGLATTQNLAGMEGGWHAGAALSCTRRQISTKSLLQQDACSRLHACDKQFASHCADRCVVPGGSVAHCPRSR